MEMKLRSVGGLLTVITLLWGCGKGYEPRSGVFPDAHPAFVLQGDTTLCFPGDMAFTLTLNWEALGLEADEVSSVSLSGGYWPQGSGDIRNGYATIRLFEISDVTLTLTTSEGEMEVTISIVPCGGGVVVPSTFTPDYDGINDVWMPIAINVTQLYWEIWSADGRLVFTNNHDINAQWWGKWGDERAPAGHYMYRIEYSTETKEAEKLSGWLECIW